MNDLFSLIGSLFYGSHQCSATPYANALLLSILAVTVIFSVGGVYVWRRFIRTNPATQPQVELAGIQ